MDDTLREVVFLAAGAATRPLLEDHPDYVFPSERVAEAVNQCLEQIGKGNDLVGETDPRKWAERFCQMVVLYPDIPRDPETMLTWFANAMQSALDAKAYDPDAVQQ